MENVTEAVTPVASVEDRMMSLLGGPDEGEPATEEVAESEAGEVTEEAEESSEPEAETITEEVPEVEDIPLEIVHNGETKRLTKAEAKELAEKGFDYTHKTQQLAEQRKAFEAQMQQSQQSVALQNAQIDTIAALKGLDAELDKFKGVNWHQLAQNDPTEYLVLNQTFRDLKDAKAEKVKELNDTAQKLQAGQQAAIQKTLAEEARKLESALPEFKGEKAAPNKAKVAAFLKDSGFTDDELGHVTDHRSIILAWKAMQYDALQKGKPDLAKKVVNVPKVLKPGTPANVAQNKYADMRKELRKTGNKDIAAKLIEQML